MTAEAKVDVYGGDYEHTLDLSNEYEGIGIRYVVRPLLEIFEGMLSNRTYEACEFSLSNYIMLKDQGASWIHAVPIFPYRAFRHSTLYVRRDSEMVHPADLRGKLVGVPDYSMTAAVWTRGILGEQYGVHWSDIRWVASGKQRFSASSDAPVELTQRDLETDLLEGRIDALLTPGTRDETNLREARKLRSLITDVQGAEEAYVAQYGIYPINHVIAVRDDALTRLPDLPSALFQAYAQSKSRAYRRRLGTTLMPWGSRYWNKVFDQFDGNPLPYGLTPLNRDVVHKLAGFLHEQKLIANEVNVDDLFVPGSEQFHE